LVGFRIRGARAVVVVRRRVIRVERLEKEK
jgi:hypothetical protein